MRLTRYILACVMSVAIVSGAQAIEYKMGFVNTERVLRDSEPARVAEKKLEREFGERVKQIKQMEEKLKDLQTRLEKDGLTLSDSQRREREREVNDMIRDLQRRQREANEELNIRRNEEYQSIIELANRVIREIAESEKFDFIFQEVVYTSSRVDITDKVLKGLTSGAKPNNQK